MDLIGALARQLDIDTSKAEAVAGAVLGSVRADAPDAETAELEAAIPELDQWEAKAKAELENDEDMTEEGGGLFGSLMSAAGSGLGNQLLGAVAGEDAAEKATAVALLGKLGLQPSHAAMAAPVVLSFLEERVSEGTLSSLLEAAPMLLGMQQLAGGGGDSGGGGAMGALGKLFG